MGAKRMEDLREILQQMKDDIQQIKQNTVTIEILEQKIQESEARTKEAIQSLYEVAITVENRAEVGDALIKSFIDALEKRMLKELHALKESQHEGLKEVTKALDQARQVLELFAERDDNQEALLHLFDQRLKKQEEATFQLKKQLCMLGGM